MTDEKECKNCSSCICPHKNKVLGYLKGGETEGEVYYLCESEVCEDNPDLCEFIIKGFQYAPEFLN